MAETRQIRDIATPTVCTAVDTDRDAIRMTTLQAYSEYGQLLAPADWEAYRQNIIAALAAVDGAEQFVVKERGQVVGAVLLCPPGSAFAQHLRGADSPEVRLLAVAPHARGRGLAVALMNECIARARDRRATALTLHTMEAMQAARRLYARMGFVRAPELDFVPRDSFVAEGYRLDLSVAAD